MIDRSHELALTTQARLLGLARSTVYREPPPVPTSDLAAMRRLDELHLDYPFAGSRMLRSMLVNEGIAIGRTTHIETETVSKPIRPPLDAQKMRWSSCERSAPRGYGLSVRWRFLRP